VTILRATDPAVLKRQFPHVDDVKDWRAQQSLRLLWDRIFALEERLQAVLATQGDLVSATNRQDDQLTAVDRKADEALAIAQVTREEQRRATGTLPGEATIPDYSAIVATVLARYDPVIPAAQAEAGKAQLTRAAAWEIYQTDPNIGLLEKTYGNQVNNLSVDIVVQMTDGSYADIAAEHDNGDGTVTILATWGPNAGDSNTTDESRWVVPTLALAETPGPMTLLP
jgi:hypothetical protein